MAKRLIIKEIPGQINQYRWMLLDAEGNVEEAPQNGPLEEIKNVNQPCDVIFIVTGIDVLLTELTLPKMSASRLVKAVPFALEGQLLQDISKTHFAISSGQNDPVISVAVVGRKKMQEWLKKLEPLNKKMKLVAFVPETIALPYDENTWSIYQDGELVYLRFSEKNAAIVDIQNFKKLYGVYLNEKTQPHSINVYVNDNEIISAVKQLTDNSTSVDTHPANNDLFALMKNVPINLLQGEFQVAKEIADTKRLLQLAAVMFFAWLLLINVFDIGKHMYLSSKQKKLKQAVGAVYKNIFPKASTVVNPKQRVQRKLNTLRSSKLQGGFMKVVREVSPVLRAVPGVTVYEANYANNKLIVELEVANFSILDKVVKDLQKRQLKVKQSDVAKTGDVIKAELMVSNANE